MERRTSSVLSDTIFCLVAAGISTLLTLPPNACCLQTGADPPRSGSSFRSQRHVVVVGGGVGGLAVAARLASSFTAEEPIRVTLLEKNPPDRLGGRCGSQSIHVESHGTFRHERGPSLLLLKSVYQDLFADCTGGESSAADYGLTMDQCIPAYQCVFDDGDTIELGFPRSAAGVNASATEAASRAKMDSYEAGGSKKWDEYLAACSAFLDCGLPNFIEERLDLPSFPAFLYESLRNNARAWPLKPHSDVLDAMFDNPKMKALASFQDLYVGLEPYRNDREWFGGIFKKSAPAVFGLLAAIELHPNNDKAGVFAPRGGFAAVSKALERLARDAGVDIRCDTTVTRVTDTGVHVLSSNGDKEVLPADTVIVNADLPYATETITKQDTGDAYNVAYDWDDSYDFASGVVAFHWSTSKRYDNLNTHNVFLSARNRSEAEQSWAVLREEGRSSNYDGMEAPFNFYVHRPVKTDPSAAPANCDSIMVLVPTETLQRKAEHASLAREEAVLRYQEQFDNDRIDIIRKATLKRMAVMPGLEDLESHIVDEILDHPGTWADDYNVAAGTPFALSHGFNQLSLTRPTIKAKGFKNVWYIGASTKPGNGVPLVLLGAKQVASQVTKSLKNQHDFVAEDERQE